MTLYMVSIVGRMKQDVQAAIDTLSTGASIRCNTMTRLLEGLGFVVRDGRKQGHKVFTHPALDAFTASSFSCGHGRNPQIKPYYVASIRKVLESHSVDLRKLEEGRK